MAALNYFSARIPFTNPDGTLTQEAIRTINSLVNRTGGVIGDAGSDVAVSQDFSYVQGQQSAGGDITADVMGAQASDQSFGDVVTQPTPTAQFDEMVMQPPSPMDRFIDAPQYTTAAAPAYKKGRIYFDTTMNKLRVGGVTAYETITSA